MNKNMAIIVFLFYIFIINLKIAFIITIMHTILLLIVKLIMLFFIFKSVFLVSQQ